MRGRRKAREIALQVLYGLNFVNVDVQEALDLFWGNFVAPKTAKEFAAFLVQGICEHKEELDNLIAGCSDNWSLGRMSRVDINILRLAVFEFLYCEDIPPKVTLNEAVDLGKTFGSENSGSFINGILDALNLQLNSKNATKHLDRKS
ncbi:transcription termination protein nusb [hydrocarbon metagenome]|uniref:Transcription termination protein nusb n=1 Tax=hydrocarbon metagenome TaxID=938273 RepID=A0A0W8FSC4_9ZZZZ